MTYLLLHADRLATLAADDPIVPAAELPAARDALALLAQAAGLHAAAEREIATAREAGHRAGVEAGTRAAREAGEAEWRATLFRLAVEAQDARRTARGEVARLAIEVVRRIAGEVGEPAFLAGLAERGAAELLPETAPIVRVPPAALDATRARLARLDGIAVEPDAALGAFDCVIETRLGSTRAGLDVQLGQLERAWAEVGDGR